MKQIAHPANPGYEGGSADIQNKSGAVSYSVGVPQGGTADKSKLGNPDARRTSDGYSCNDGGLGFSSDSRMSKSGYSGSFGNMGYESRGLPDRSDVQTANALANDSTKSRPKLSNARKPSAT